MRLIACIAVMAMLFVPIGMSAPVSGAIFTTSSTCTGVNLNIYASKDDVYLDGGPAHPGAAGLPDGSYYVRVTVPDGTTVLGKSLTPVVTVSGGEFASCYQVSAIVLSAASGFTAAGFNDTSNPGGEYKVWVSNVSTFDNDSSKTDNFKVKVGTVDPGTLRVRKFYDANANGINDDGQLITGWKIRIQDNIDYIRFTPVDIILDADTYYVTECTPLEKNWVATTQPLTVQLNNGDDTTASIGNVCLGAGGGLTLGFWSNKNGQGLLNYSDLASLGSLNLRDAYGANYDPASYSFRTWLLSATATNMSYMLSAQLAATSLDVAHGFVKGSALIYAPGTASANPLGFASVNAVVAEANTELGVHGLVLSGNSFRSYQERLKNALDNANNNRSFVQPAPCPFSFAP